MGAGPTLLFFLLDSLVPAIEGLGMTGFTDPMVLFAVLDGSGEGAYVLGGCALLEQMEPLGEGARLGVEVGV